jgi:hypothetical protein
MLEIELKKMQNDCLDAELNRDPNKMEKPTA